MDNSQPDNENNSKKTPPCINTEEEEQENKLPVRITHTGTPPHTDKGLTADEEAHREQWLRFEAWRVGLVNNE